jgi:hypothetical protein
MDLRQRQSGDLDSSPFQVEVQVPEPNIPEPPARSGGQRLLDFLPPGAIKSVVVFTGQAEFKTEIPQGVFRTSGLIDYLREQTVEVMSPNRVQFCVGRLETARLAISGKTTLNTFRALSGGTTVRPLSSALGGT